MSDVLSKICDDKQEHVVARKARCPQNVLEATALAAGPTRGFYQALKSKVFHEQFGLIAEIKKASPSKGLIREDFVPDELARAYEKGGAACLSVLTDIPYFQGADEYLVMAQKAVKLPVLRKDFMVDLYQVYEARALGADCILIIMAAVDDVLARELEECAHSLGMDCLIEVHDEAEMQRALRLRSPLIGVNNRNLKTMEVSLETTKRLAKMVPDDRLIVCESGISSNEELKIMSSHRAHCFLVGETLMRQDNVQMATQNLLGIIKEG